MFPSSKQIQWTSMALALAVALTASPLEAGKQKKKKKKSKEKPAQTAQATGGSSQTQAAAPPALGQVERLLLAYSTGEARQALDGVEDSHPAVAVARARVLEQEKRYDEAIAELNRVADANPDDPSAVYFLGETYLHADRQGPANDAFTRTESRARKLLQGDPNSGEALYYLAVAQQRQQRYNDALATLEKARQADPGNNLVQFQIGVTHAFNKSWQQAVDALTAALSKDSGLAYAYYYRGLSAGQINRKDLMVNDLDRFLAMAPEAPEAPRARKVLESV